MPAILTDHDHHARSAPATQVRDAARAGDATRGGPAYDGRALDDRARIGRTHDGRPGERARHRAPATAPAMRTAADAIAVLARAHTPAGLRRLAAVLGYPDACAVPMATAAMLGGHDVAPVIERATRDDGTALLALHGVDPGRWREAIARVATALDRAHDLRRWLIVAHTTDGAQVIVATWLAAPRAPRIAALVAERAAPLDADAQVLLAVAAARATDPGSLALRWHELLGRTAITRRFFAQLETQVLALADSWSGRIAADDRRTLAIITTARLLFLKFLEAKGWLDGDRDFLVHRTHAVLERGGSLWDRLLCPLTFGTLNTPPTKRAATARAFGQVPFLNGGLFARTALEEACRRPRAPDAPLAALLLDVLARHRFTAREDARNWSEAAIDPDMLGRTFEALMHPSARRGSGSFYTPAPLAHDLVHDALAHALATPATPHTIVRAALAGDAPPDATARALLVHRARTLRCLDPACGSGALLVTALEALATLRHACGDRVTDDRARARSTARSGPRIDRAAPDPRTPDGDALHRIRRDVLARSIFGVDIAPLAVWLTELRCWLALVIDDATPDPRDVPPLPNLDHHIRTGDALAATDTHAHPALARALAPLRTRYLAATGARKRALAARLDDAERRLARAHADHRIATLTRERADLLQAGRARTLFGDRAGLAPAARARLRTLKRDLADARRHARALHTGAPLPFAFATHFADAIAGGGFDVIIGNPPWIRPHRTDAATRTTLRTHFAHLARTSAGTAFGAQPDVAAAFTDRALALLAPHGVLAFVLPAKLWRSLAGGALRARLLARATPIAIADFGDDPSGFGAAVYPSTLLARRHPPPSDAAMPTASIACAARDASGALQHFTIAAPRLRARDTADAPWLLVPHAVRDAADRLVHAGTPWVDTTLPAPALGCKTGCNDAFLVAARAVTPALARWTRPALRGETLHAWHTPTPRDAIVTPLDDGGAPLDRLPAALAHHFAPHEQALRQRTDLRPRDRWWSLFRTDLVAAGGWRVVWADIGRSLRATLLTPRSRTVPLNSCYGIRCADPIDAHALLALLNAPLASAFLSLVAEPARGGFHRFLGFTVAGLPLPDWDRARHRLAPIAADARRGSPIDVADLHRATLDAYRLRHHHVAPLLAWAAHERRTRALGRPDGPSSDARHADAPA